MSKRTFFTTISPLPSSVTRGIVMEMLHTYTDIIDLNPLVEERHPIKPPPNATPEEYHCAWYSLTDRVHYLPGGIISGKVSYNVCFHGLKNGLQAHYYAPLGLNVKNKWTLCGSLPGEAMTPVEIGVGAPLSGLYLREDVKMTCNFMATPYVKKSIKKAHALLVSRLVARAQFLDVRPTISSLDGGFTKHQPDYEPIEFGRDGQNTQDSHLESNVASPTRSTLSHIEPSRPSTANFDSESKLAMRLSLNNTSLPWINKSKRTRAFSSYNSVAPNSLWEQLNTVGNDSSVPPLVLKNEPSDHNICYELDTQEQAKITEKVDQCWEMDTETEIRVNLLEKKVKRSNSLHKEVMNKPVELEG